MTPGASSAPFPGEKGGHSPGGNLRFLVLLPPLLLLVWVLPLVFGAEFTLDDRQALLENPAIARFDLAALFGQDFWAYHGGSFMYRPLTALSLSIDLQLFGPDPLQLKRVNLFLHGLCCMVLASGLHGLCGRGFLPFLLALLLHPLSAEQAFWISGRSGSLMFLFGGLSLLAARGARWGPASLLVLCSALCRDDGILFLPLILGLFPRKRRRGLFWAAGLLLLWLALRAGAVDFPPSRLLDERGLGERIGDAAAGFGTYLRWILLLEPPRIMSLSLPPAGLFLPGLPLLLLAALALRRRRGPLWVLLAFLPFSFLMLRGDGVAGRFAFALLPGLCLFLGDQVPRRTRRIPRGRAPVLACLPLLLLPFWLREAWVHGDSRRLYARILEAEPENPKAGLMLALAEEDHGRPEEALRRLGELKRRFPRYAKAWVNHGRLLWLLGRKEEGRQALERACERFPGSPRAFLTLGRCLYDLGDFAGAERAFRRCLEGNPRQGQAARYLCRSLFRLGRKAEAREALGRAERLDPGHPDLPRLWRLSRD